MADISVLNFGDGVNRNIKDVTSRVLLPATVGWTGKNLLENLGTSQEINDVVFTIYDDGSVKAHGTASANATLYLTSKALNADFLSSLSGKSIILSGGHSDNKRVQMWSTNGGVVYSGASEIAIDVTSPIASSADYNIVINILQGQVCDNEMFYPMIRLATVTDPTYEPYHKSVEECKADNSVIAPVESGTTASQAYAQGAHFIKDGAFCTAITSIASGATLTENTNYIEGTIGDYLSEKILLNTDTTLSSSDLTELTLAEHSGNFRNVVLIGYVNSNSAGNRFVINCPAKAIQSAATINLSVVGWINQSNNTFLICIEVKTNKTIISARDYNNNYISNVHIVKVIGYR